jgi:hypothetical protein
MSVQVTINGEVFNYPANRDPAGWGGEATDAFVELANVVASVAGAQDILQTAANIANNQTSVANVVGLSFNPSLVRGARVDYNVYRVTSTNEVVEQASMYLSYKPNAALWDITTVGSQGANIVWSITSLGQVQYTSDNMPGSSYSGQITFRAIALT